MADNSNLPLVVDLDGTLIRTDMTWELLSRLLRRNPFALVQVLFWLTRGRARLKQKLGERVQFNPAALPYHEKFLAWLRAEKKSGRKIILATASDLKMAQPVAAYVGLFDEVLASDGQINLRSENKLRALTKKFGERGFDYAGNSSADFAVWRGSREAVVVNASRRVRREAANCTKVGATFCEDFSAVAVAKSFCTELFWRSGYLLAIVAGLLLAAAFPKIGVAGAAWVAPALMLFAARGKNGADAFRVGYVSGITFWLASLYWLLLMPAVGFPILGWLALAAYVALFFGAWVWLVSNFKFQISNWIGRVRWTLTGAAAWVALELLRGWLFSGFPWSYLGASQYKLVPLIQIASTTGVYGVSFLVVWLSLALYAAVEMIFRNPAKRHVWQAEIALPLVTVLLLFVGGTLAVNRETPAGKTLRVTLVQPSVPQTLIWSPTEDEKRFAELLATSQRALDSEGRVPLVPNSNDTANSGTPGTRPSDLLVWPESAVPMLDGAYDTVSRFARSNHVAILFNGDDADFRPDATNFFNSAFFIQPDGKCAGVYHKQKLVIFGEYVPLARWLPFLKYLTPIEGGWTPGDKPVVFQLAGRGERPREPLVNLDGGSPGVSPHQPINISPLICFEDVFPGTARAAAAGGPDLLVNLTNDGWFGESAEQWQHLANAVFRAVENGVPLVRCANNGVTGWIDAHGRVREIFRTSAGSEYGPGALTVEIPLPAATEKPAPTFYQRHGDWFGWGCAAWVLAALIARRKPTRP
ncbi:MAG TPA: apolipoprotein N-acyltransferase [Verrucomicrobiae bacterium]